MVGADVNAHGGRVMHEGGTAVGDGVVNLDSDSGMELQTEGTFAGLSDLASNLFAPGGDFEEVAAQITPSVGPALEKVAAQTIATSESRVHGSTQIIQEPATTVEAEQKSVSKGVKGFSILPQIHDFCLTLEKKTQIPRSFKNPLKPSESSLPLNLLIDEIEAPGI
ncbi:hypothetical protein ACLB2K_044992 [Fragaria x ananassa]